MLNYILEDGKKKRAMLDETSSKVDQGICIISLLGFLTVGLVGIII